MSLLCFLSIAHYRWTQIVWLDTNTISWKGQKRIHQLLLSRDAVLTGPSAGENGQHCPWPRGQFVLGPQSPVSQTDCTLSLHVGEALGAPDREQAQGAALPLLYLSILILEVFFLMPTLDLHSFSLKQSPYVPPQKVLLKTLSPSFFLLGPLWVLEGHNKISPAPSLPWAEGSLNYMPLFFDQVTLLLYHPSSWAQWAAAQTAMPPELMEWCKGQEWWEKLQGGHETCLRKQEYQYLSNYHNLRQWEKEGKKEDGGRGPWKKGLMERVTSFLTPERSSVPCCLAVHLRDICHSATCRANLLPLCAETSGFHNREGEGRTLLVTVFRARIQQHMSNSLNWHSWRYVFWCAVPCY